MQIDRIQVVVEDRAATAARWQQLLGAEVAREDKLESLHARRTVLAVGTSCAELLEPDGAGPVENFASTRGAGLFAAGFGIDSLADLRAGLASRQIEYGEEAGQLFLEPGATGGSGLRIVVSELESRERVGLLQRLYEVTNLVEDAPAAIDALAQVFALDPEPFVPIRSEQYGYDGALTLFRPRELDRVEIIKPFDRGKTMGRFMDRCGPCLYMCYGETDRPGDIRDRAREHAPKQWTGPADGPPDNQFLHPRALGGMMMGISRTTFAWTWSGDPDRVEP
jgi:hypothetical protein